MPTTFSELEQHVREQWTKDQEEILILIERHLQSQLDLWNTWTQVPQGTWVEVGVLLWGRSFDSVRLGVELLKSGYMTQSAALMRQAYEDLLTIEYLEKYPNIAKTYYKRRGGPPRFKDMAKDLGHERWWDDHYNGLAEYTHPKAAAAASRRIGDAVRIGPSYDAEMFSALLKVIISGMVMSTSNLCKLIVAAGNSADETLIGRVIEEQQELILTARGNVRG